MSVFGTVASALFAFAALMTVAIHYGQDEHLPWAYYHKESKFPTEIAHLQGENEHAPVRDNITHVQMFVGLDETHRVTWSSGDLTDLARNDPELEWTKELEGDLKKAADKRVTKRVEEMETKRNYWSNVFQNFQRTHMDGKECKVSTKFSDGEIPEDESDENKKAREHNVKTEKLTNAVTEARCNRSYHCRKAKTVVNGTTLVASLFAVAAVIAVSNNKATTAGAAGIVSGLATLTAVLNYSIGCYHSGVTELGANKDLADYIEERERAAINDSEAKDADKTHQLSKIATVTEYSMLHISFFLALAATVASFVGGVLVLIAHKRNEPLTRVVPVAGSAASQQA